MLDKDPVIIVSQPKAGTHLLAEIIRRMGWYYTYYHLGQKTLDAYDPFDFESGRKRLGDVRLKLPLKDSLKLVRRGQLAVSHLPFENDIPVLLAKFKVVFLKREVRRALFSHMRFLRKTGRLNASKKKWGQEKDLSVAMVHYLKDRGRDEIRAVKKIAKWGAVENVLNIRFEQLIKKDKEILAQLEEFLGAEVGKQRNDLIAEALASETLTVSTDKVSFSDIWTPEAEKLFVAKGGVELNRLLGYQ